MRMPGGSFRLTWPVLNLTHLVHVNKRIQEPLIETVKRPANRKSLALHSLRRGRDGEHRPLAFARIGDCNPWQGQDVIDGDSGHLTSVNPIAVNPIPE